MNQPPNEDVVIDDIADSDDHSRYSRRGRPRSRITPKSRWRLVILQVLLASLVVTLLGRLTYMQVTGSGQAAAAVESRVRDIVIPAPRGLVVDQAGREMLRNRPATDVLLDRAVVLSQPDGGAAEIAALSALTGTPEADIRARLVACGKPEAGPTCFTGGPYEPVPVVIDTQVESVVDLIENPARYPGLTVRTRAERDYLTPIPANAAHLLGYLGSPTQAELDADETLYAGEDIGRAGVEASYDDYLRGQNGAQRLALDRTGITGEVVSESAPTPGNTVVLSIDAQLQQVLETQVQAAVDRAQSNGFVADSAAGVVLDVTNGQVLAMASVPTYDTSVFADGLSDAEFAELTDGDKPLFNRVIQGEFAPASTFKVVSTSAAARAGYPLDGTYACPSSFNVGSQVFTNHESAGYGSLSLKEALEVSCNTVFYQFANDMYFADGGTNANPDAQELMTNTAKAFGLGTRTGIDLPGESAGRIVDRARKVSDYAELKDVYCERAETGYPEEEDPDKAELFRRYAEEYCADGSKYRVGDAINFAVGQGDSVVTPLQLATVYAAIANGGTLYQPHVAKAVVSPTGEVVQEIEPVVNGQIPTDPATLAFIQDALQGVTQEGTASGAFGGFPLDEIPVASKTGSAEVDGKQSTSWFASYAPANNPRYAVVIMVTQGGTGSETSAPSVRAVYEAIYGITDGQPDPARSVLVGGAPSPTLPTLARAQ